MTFRKKSSTFAQLIGLTFSLSMLPHLAFSQTSAQDLTNIDLRLFGKDLLESYDGCHVAFWQKDRDPRTDKFSYVFYAPFNDGVELPGWVKIGKTVYEFERKDKVESTNRMLEPLRLYRDLDSGHSLLVEILSQKERGDDLSVEDARLTFWHRKKAPFSIRVQGELACSPAAYEAAQAGGSQQSVAIGPPVEGDEISLGKPRDFQGLKGVPAGVLKAAKAAPVACEPENTPGFGARYEVSSGMDIWEVPCRLYNRNGSAVLVASSPANRNHSVVLPVPQLPSEGSSEAFEILNPQIKVRGAFVKSLSYGRDASCGTLARYQIRAVEGEALELFLIEYRKKDDCDGVETAPEDFPLLYRRQ